MNYLPRIIRVRENSGRTVSGSFVDPEWVLHYIAAGSWIFQLKSRSYEVKAGDMVLIPPRLLHIVRPQTAGPLIQLVIHFELPDFSLPKDFPYALTLPPKRRRQIKLLFRDLHREQGFAAPHANLTAGGMLATMLGIYLQNSKMEKPAQEERLMAWAQIEKAIQHIQRNYQKVDLALPEISAAAYLSLNYFCRIFKMHTGHSAMSYLNQFRVQKAEELLLHSHWNCSEIGEKIGYSGIHVFSRTFKKHRGMSPTAFRDRYLRRQG